MSFEIPRRASFLGRGNSSKPISPAMYKSARRDNQSGIFFNSSSFSSTSAAATRKTPHSVSLKKYSLARRGYKSFEEWNSDPNHVYIGRCMSHHVEGAHGSKWGNPFKAKKANKNSLNKCLERYEDYIRRNPDLFNAVTELEGKELGCWCKPSPCHGDILVKLFKERQGPDPWSSESDYQRFTSVIMHYGSNEESGDDSGNNSAFKDTFDRDDTEVDEFNAPFQLGLELYETISDLSSECELSVVAPTPIDMEPIINPLECDKLDALEISITNSVTSVSLPLLDSTPLIINDSTPNISLNEESSDINDITTPSTLTQSALSGKPADTDNSDNEDLNFLRNTLRNAGYTPSEADNGIMAYIGKEKECNHETYDKNKPLTHIFSHGKVYTYEKLNTVVTTNVKKSRSKSERLEISSTTEEKEGYCLERSHLNPQAISFTPRIDLCAFTNLKNIRINNMKNVIIGQLNINSLRNKFQSLVEIIHGNLDILVITETKLDHTFPEKQFLIPGYKKPYRRDRNRNGGGVMIYVREDIPCDILIKHKMPTNIEAIFLEINLRKNKLLLVGTYHSTNKEHGEKDDKYFQQIGFALDVYSRYDKFLLAGDFNVVENDHCLGEFMADFHAKNLVKEPTCFKNLSNPSCIDLFITNSYRSFQNTTTVATGLSDFHKMTVTVLKTTFPKAKPKVITYRTPFDPLDLENALKENLEGMVEKTYENFENNVNKSYNSVSTEKQRTVRANEKPWVTKEMRKEIMYRSQLENRKFKFGREEDVQAFKRQQNYCNRLYHRARKEYCDKLDIKNITDNTKFWDTMKPLFSDKGGIRDRIMLVENDQIISDSKEVA